MKTKIEWVKNEDGTQGYTINPVKGLCPVACDYCYARRMYKRFKWNPKIRFDGNVLTDFPDKPSRIFVGSTMELFGDWVKPEWMEQIMALPFNFPQHTFIFLTKQPENLPKEFPSNCWVGISATSHNELANRWGIMGQVKASVKFVSLEPLLDWADDTHSHIYQEGIINSGIQLVIIGQCTPVKKATMPKVEWIAEIVGAADKAHIPVFLKNNLNKVTNIHDEKTYCEHSNLFEIGADYAFNLRQEFPLP